ncbi:MAG: HAMP domain-containing protein [Coriobacteriia bacterium]|nr:HAMP domain-containing protein [Coriobacteriia bacterium]MBN2822489.1 HAMP domain-containing protein [Coriobacteriia bacterium]
MRSPGRTRIRTRLLAAFLIVAVTSAAGLSAYFLKELEGFALRKLEERLHTESLIVAEIVSEAYMGDGRLSSAETDGLTTALQAAGPDIFSRVRVLDAQGVALVDSAGDDGVGEAYGELSEIQTALAGDYGAATRVTASDRVALYIAEPIIHDGTVVGVAYSSSTTFSIVTLLQTYRTRLLVVVLLFVGVTFALTELLARWLSAPLRDLSDGAQAFAAGDHSVRATPMGSLETRAVAEAFNAMGDEVERVVRELKDEELRTTRFVSDVSHELRTPLTAIRGAAETLLEGDVPADDERRFLETMVRESDRLGRLANDLLTLQRIEGATGELPLRRVRLRVIAERAAESLEPLTDGRGVSVTIAGEGPTVLGDSDRLQQVVGNLLDNASRMTPKGGAITIVLSRENGFATLSVLDEGPGIPEDALPHLFDRFYRAQASRDRSTGGAGLGLAIVHAIVQAHAGTITAGNLPHGGSAFTLRLPAIDD